MTAQTKVQSESKEVQSKGNFLSKVLRADGVFATFSGLVIVLGSSVLASLFELERPVVLVIVGVVFLLYGLDLLYFTGRGANNRAIAIFAIAVNLIYVAVSFGGLLFDLFPVNVAGKWAIGLAAEVVFVFAALEYIGLRKEARE